MTRPHQGFTLMVSLLVAVVLLLGACGGSEGPSGGSDADGESPELQEVSIRMDWTAGGYHAPFVLAQKKGFYAEEGLTVEVLEGKGSTNTSQVVANGGDTFGFVNLATAMTVSGQGAPIKGVAAIVQKSPTIIASRADADILEPDDLVGKRVGRDPGGADAQMIPLFLDKTGVAEDDVTFVNTTSATTLPLLAKGDIDAAQYESIYQIPILVEQDIPHNVMYFADYDLNTISYSIIASDSTLQEQTDLVERFVRASLKGWEYAVQNPEEAVEALVEEFPSTSAESALQQFELTIPLLHTDATEGKPIGCTADEDILKTETTLATAGIMTAPKNEAGAYFQQGFAPC